MKIACIKISKIKLNTKTAKKLIFHLFSLSSNLPFVEVRETAVHVGLLHF